jgi:hypothetical protein
VLAHSQHGANPIGRDGVRFSEPQARPNTGDDDERFAALFDYDDSQFVRHHRPRINLPVWAPFEIYAVEFASGVYGRVANRVSSSAFNGYGSRIHLQGLFRLKGPANESNGIDQSGVLL